MNTNLEPRIRLRQAVFAKSSGEPRATACNYADDTDLVVEAIKLNRLCSGKQTYGMATRRYSPARVAVTSD